MQDQPQQQISRLLRARFLIPEFPILVGLCNGIWFLCFAKFRYCFVKVGASYENRNGSKIFWLSWTNEGLYFLHKSFEQHYRL